jgi:cell shape-determining protein MreC
MATATANFADHMNSGWLTSLEKSLAQMSEYTNQRKKLDSRRLTYDAMLAKVQKSKKEKRDLEDDLRVAKNRYEETSEEVQERAVAIQDSESDQLIALTKLLEIESNWIDEQKRILDDLKKNWVDPF